MKIKDVESQLKRVPARWLVTGCAGFIGSNLIEYLLNIGQSVVGLDNFSTGKKTNLLDVERNVGPEAWKRFTFIEGDICSIDTCRRAVQDVTYVLHQAALGSVPKSIEDPLTWNRVNVDGFLNVITAARDARVQGFVYASSSSVYGDSKELPKVERRIGVPLSPYAVSKYANELYGEVYARCYEFRSVGLRYFNVFGKRQDPEGAYAAVIPKWIDCMVSGVQAVINGDGSTTRDFCYIQNVVQANILAATTPLSDRHRAFNVGVGEQTDLKILYNALRSAITEKTGKEIPEPEFASFRAGDIQHSLASKEAIESQLGYVATHTLSQGLSECLPWYLGAR